MKYRALGVSGLEASVVALGTWAIGGWMWGGTDEAESIKAIHASIDAGVNLIDTAAIYGFGLSEEIVGKAIAGKRDQVIVATKCGLRWELEKGEHHFDSEGKKIYKYLGPESIKWEVEQSLKRLNIDCIDLYQTHWQDPTTPITDTMGALVDLQNEGKIRAIGACNLTAEHLEQYRKAGAIASAQNKYSMLDREDENDLLPYCRDNNIAFLAYSPLALGLLTGKISPGRKFNKGDLRLGRDRFHPENLKRTADMLSEFKPVAKAHGVTIAQLVIAWTINRPGLTHALVGARNVSQAEENARAADISLREEEISKIDRMLSERL